MNTEHKFVTLYVFNSEQNICIYYSVQFLLTVIKSKKNFCLLLGPIILLGPGNTE